jgi:hypothetical protein
MSKEFQNLVYNPCLAVDKWLIRYLRNHTDDVRLMLRLVLDETLLLGHVAPNTVARCGEQLMTGDVKMEDCERAVTQWNNECVYLWQKCCYNIAADPLAKVFNRLVCLSPILLYRDSTVNEKETK